MIILACQYSVNIVANAHVIIKICEDTQEMPQSKVQPSQCMKEREIKRTNNDKTTITKTRLFKYIEYFTTEKKENFQINSDIFHISAQTIDCGTR